MPSSKTSSGQTRRAVRASRGASAKRARRATTQGASAKRARRATTQGARARANARRPVQAATRKPSVKLDLLRQLQISGPAVHCVTGVWQDVNKTALDKRVLDKQVAAGVVSRFEQKRDYGGVETFYWVNASGLSHLNPTLALLAKGQVDICLADCAYQGVRGVDIDTAAIQREVRCGRIAARIPTPTDHFIHARRRDLRWLARGPIQVSYTITALGRAVLKPLPPARRVLRRTDDAATAPLSAAGRSLGRTYATGFFARRSRPGGRRRRVFVH